MDKCIHCGIPGTKDHTLFGGIRENFPEKGMLGSVLKNHVGVWPSNEVGRECQVEGVKILLDGWVKWSIRNWEWSECVCVCMCARMCV